MTQENYVSLCKNSGGWVAKSNCCSFIEPMFASPHHYREFTNNCNFRYTDLINYSGLQELQHTCGLNVHRQTQLPKKKKEEDKCFLLVKGIHAAKGLTM